MKAYQKLFAAAAAVLLCLSLCAPALAAETAAAPDWDAITAQVLAEYGVVENQVRLGYRNLVTGEEHYLNGDVYSVAASMVKLPMCMICTEKLDQIDWSPYEQYFSYQEIQNAVLIDSDNKGYELLKTIFFNEDYNKFRLETASYMGVEPGTEPTENTMNNQYTAREFINCLTLLYDNPERFPNILETMQLAMPGRFFKLNEPRYSIAHKPGWISEDLILNDCAICFTAQPIAIVAFGSGGVVSEEFLSAWCTAVCEYTDKLANTPAPTLEPTAAPTPVPAAAVTPAPAQASADVPERVELPMLVPQAAIGAFLLAGLIFIIVLCAKYRARFIGLFLALVISAAGMAMAGFGLYYGTVYARPSGDPVESVTRFFDAVCAGDYAAAYPELRDYADLGLAQTPSSPAGQKVYRALHNSFSYTLEGECRTEMLQSAQTVRFTRLDLAALETAVAAETQRQAERIVQQRPVSSVYNTAGQVLPAVAEEAYLAALDVVLQSAPAYYTADNLDLSLTYTDGRWQIVADAALLRALAGGIA